MPAPNADDAAPPQTGYRPGIIFPHNNKVGQGVHPWKIFKNFPIKRTILNQFTSYADQIFSFFAW